MKFLSCARWYVSLAQRPGKSPVRRRRHMLPVFEQLESRELLTSFVVTNVADTTDVGTLRWAIEQANTSGGSDTISFDSSFAAPQTIVLNGTELPLFDDATGLTTVSGPGNALLTISGNDLSRVFDVASGANVSLNGLTISHGNAGDEGGGGIRNAGVLSVSDVILSANTAVPVVFDSVEAGYGGGIYNAGLLTISNSTIENSSAQSSGGGLANVGTLVASHVQILNNSAGYYGGGLYTSGAATLQYCLIDQNSVLSPTFMEGFGGGIYQRQGNATYLTLFYSTMSNNTAKEGGGIDSSGKMNIVNSTLNGNQADKGGAIYSSKEMDLANSTLTNNAAQYGGAIYNRGEMDLTSLTVSGNLAASQGAGILTYGTPAFTLTNSIVVDNLVSGTANNIDGNANGINFTRNLIGPSNVFNLSAAENGNIILQAQADAGLGVLGNYGGFTQTIPLLPGSPALDPSWYTPNELQSFAFDQRGPGFQRAEGTSPDMGAFEANYLLTAISLVEGSYFIANLTSPGLTAFPLTYTLTGGADQDQFYLQDDGYLSFQSAPDYLHPTDAGLNNTYEAQITVTDANGLTATRNLTVTVTDFVHKPELAQTFAAATYHLGAAPVIDPGVTFSADPIATDFSTAKLTASLSGKLSGDMLRIVAQGTGAGQISVKKNKILYGGVMIGSFTGGTKKDPNLVISFNTATNAAAVQQLARQIGFSTKNKHLPQSSRYLNLQITNLYGQNSDLSYRPINVVARK
jgi:predicted outer membrane repeat protein